MAPKQQRARAVALLPSALLPGADEERRLVPGELIVGAKNAAPKAGEGGARYYLVEDGKEEDGKEEERTGECAVLELQQWKARNTSWLFTSGSGEGGDGREPRRAGAREDYLEQDGSLFMFTPVDPLFAFLPALDAAKVDGYQPLEQIADLTSGERGQSPRMLGALRSAARCACDVKSVGGTEYYRLNDVRVVSWLDCKLRRLISYFGAHGEEAVRSLGADVLRLYCINILGEWVGSEWTAWLKALHGLEDPAVAKQVAAAVSTMDDEDRARVRPAGKPADDARTHMQKVEEGRLKSKLEKNAKAARGSKSIMSFFSKK